MNLNVYGLPWFCEHSVKPVEGWRRKECSVPTRGPRAAKRRQCTRGYKLESVRLRAEGTTSIAAVAEGLGIGVHQFTVASRIRSRWRSRVSRQREPKLSPSAAHRAGSPIGLLEIHCFRVSDPSATATGRSGQSVAPLERPDKFQIPYFLEGRAKVPPPEAGAL
jgi:hypothetical protein